MDALRNRIVEKREMPLWDILPHATNPKDHPDGQRTALRTILNEIGWAGSALAYYSERNGGKLTLIDAHLRREEVPKDFRADVLITDLTDEEADKLILVYDPIAAMAEMNRARVAQLLDGRGEGAVARLMEEVAARAGMGAEKEPKDAVPQTDKASELQEKWQVQPGELFEIGAHRLICGDCTDAATVAKLMGGEKADLWIADPPYGIDWKGSNASTLEWEGIEGDRDTELVARFIPLIPSEQQAVVFGANCFPSLLPHRGRWICWDKRVTEEADRMIGSPFELAWMNKTHGFDVIVRVQHGGALNADGGKRFHPTQKPVALYTTIITTAYKDIKSIYDPFSGSGTTMIASQNLNRICYGCEIEQKFAAVILERMTTAFPGLEITRYPPE